MRARNLLLVLSVSTCLNIAAIAAEKVSKIVVVGNRNVSDGFIKSKIGFIQGAEFNETKVNEAVKTLYRTDFFNSVAISKKNGVITVDVKELPLVSKVVYEGNKKVKDEQIKLSTKMKPRMPLNKAIIQDDVEIILMSYHHIGRYGVKVEPKIIERGPGKVDLIYEINEGEKSKIKKINFIGNKHFSDFALQSEITTSIYRWYAFFNNKDHYSPMQIENDKDIITNFYRKNGYARARVISSIMELDSNNRDVYVNFTVEEGERYMIKDIIFNNKIKDLDGSKLEEFVKKIRNSWYNFLEIEKAKLEISNYLNSKSFPFANVLVTEDYDDDNKLVTLQFNVVEGYKAYIDRIDIRGNSRTIDPVIRREMDLNEGEAFNSDKLNRSKRRLENLNYFESSEIVPLATNNREKINLLVNIQEKSTASLNFAAGYSTLDKVIGKISFSETNLLGRGYLLDIGVSKASKRLDTDFSITNPYFLGKNFAATVGMAKTSQKRDHSSHKFVLYNNSESNYFVGGRYFIADKWIHAVKYNFKESDISNIDTKLIPANIATGSPAIIASIMQTESRRQTNSSITNSLIYDSRNSIFDPTNGYYGSISQEIAGLGGNVKYLKHNASLKKFTGLFNDKVIVMFSGEAGHIQPWNKGDFVKMIDRFTLGGGSSFRGFDYQGLGPRLKVWDPVTNKYLDNNFNGGSLGGNIYYSGTVEAKYPFRSLKELNMFSSAFCDFGSLYNLNSIYPKDAYFSSRSIRASFGVGIGFATPMGPLRLSYAWPIKKERFDEVKRFDIVFTTQF